MVSPTDLQLAHQYGLVSTKTTNRSLTMDAPYMESCVERFMTKGKITRRMIVAKAAPVFNRKGYHGSSLADLMTATGLKKGGIYRYFSTKEELAVEAFDFTWDAVSEARMLHVDEEPSAVDSLKRIIANFVVHKSPVDGGCPILKTAVEADDGNPVLRARVTRALRSWVGAMQSIIKQGGVRGEIRPGVDPKATAVLIVATLEGALMISRLEGNQDALQRVHQHLNTYLENEVAAPSAEAP
jgi:TetR/AcrR family transcriptional regulator, transcriptional repressor for nem operon